MSTTNTNPQGDLVAPQVDQPMTPRTVPKCYVCQDDIVDVAHPDVHFHAGGDVLVCRTCVRTVREAVLRDAETHICGPALSYLMSLTKKDRLTPREIVDMRVALATLPPLITIGFRVHADSMRTWLTFDAPCISDQSDRSALAIFKNLQLRFYNYYVNLNHRSLVFINRVGIERFVKSFTYASGACMFATTIAGAYFNLSYPVMFFNNLIAMTISLFIVVSALNGTHGEATNEDDLASKASVVSTFGDYQYEFDNTPKGRRDEHVHAPASTIRSTLSRCKKVKADTKKIRRAAEKAHRRNQQSARELERCEREFQKVLDFLSPNLPQAGPDDDSPPQSGFNMGAWLKRFGTAPGRFVDGCQSFIRSVQSASAGINYLTGLAEEVMPWLKTVATTTVVLVCAGVCVYAILSGRKILAVVTAGLLSAYALSLGSGIADQLNKFVESLPRYFEKMPTVATPTFSEPESKSIFEDAPTGSFTNEMPTKISSDDLKPPPPNQAQGNTACELDSATITKLFVSLFSASFFAFGDKKKGTFSLLKDYVVHFPSITKGVEGIIEFSSKAVLGMLNAVRKSLGYELYESLLDRRDPFTNWIDEADKFVNDVNNGAIKLSSGVLGQTNAYIDQGREHYKFLRAVSDDYGARTRLGTVMTALAGVRDRCVPFNSNFVSARPEPVCIYLYSPPGRGKTALAKSFVKAYMKRVLDTAAYALYEKNPEAYVYYRTPETEYWDGYANQMATIFDDFGQKREVAGGESAALDVIRCMNGAVSLLHMASLKDKGNTYFTSDLVILTSNVEIMNSDAVVDNDAVRRRPDFYLEVDFQPELKVKTDALDKPQFDPTLMAAFNSLPNWEDRTSVYTLRQYHVGRNRSRINADFITPLQLLDAVCLLRDKNRDKFAGIVPPAAEARVQEAADFSKLFRERAKADGGKPSNKEPISGNPRPNAAQGASEDMLRFGKKFNNEEDYEEFLCTMSDFLDAVKIHGPQSDVACNHQAQLDLILGKIGWTADGALCGPFHPHYATAKNQFRKLSPPTESIRDLRTSAMLDDTEKMSHKQYFLSFFSKWATKAQTLGANMWEFFTKHWGLILSVAAAIGFGLALYKNINLWTSLDNEAQSVPVRMKTQLQKRRPGMNLFKRAPNAPQSTEVLEKQCNRLLKHNYHIFWSETSDTCFGNVQMIWDRVGILNAHTCDLIAAKAKQGLKSVWLGKNGQKIARLGVSVAPFLEANRSEDVADMDLTMVYLDGCGVAPAPDFRRVIPTWHDFDGRSQMLVLCPKLVPNGAARVFFVDPRAIICRDTGPYPGPDRGDGEPYVYTNGVNVSYQIETIPGQCGMPLVTDTFSQGKYFGLLHKCGTGVIGGAAPVFIEWVERELDVLRRKHPNLDKKQVTYWEDFEFQEPPNSAQGVFPQCYPFETVGVTKPFHASVDTKLEKLPHAHMFDLNAAPAQMDTAKVDGHWTNPYIKNREKAPKVLPEFPPVEDLDKVVSAVINNVKLPEVADLKMWRRRMTYEEAVYGIDGTVFAGLDMQTSVGYPRVLSGHTTKHAWFSDPVRREQVRGEVYSKLALLKRGFRPLFLNMDVLKDERRTLEKVLTCSTRVVVVGPLDLLIIMRMFFGGFVTWTQLNKIQNGVTIGMNPYSQELDAMCQNLFANGFKPFAGDSAQFDLCQHPQLLRAIFGAINDWYHDEDNPVRLILSLEFMFPYHVTFPVTVSPAVIAELKAEPIPDDPFTVSHFLKIINASNHRHVAFIYVAVFGHPSGAYLTACVNSWYSVTIIIVVVVWVTKDPAVGLRVLHDKLVRFCTLGDDFVYSIAPSFQSVVNAHVFAQFSALYGMKVTREDKTPITTAFPEEDIYFLKRWLHFDPNIGRWVGSMKLTAIVDAFCWMRVSKGHRPTDSELRLMFGQQICELSLWGPKVYAEWAPKFQLGAEETLRSTFVLPSWNDALIACSAIPADHRP